VDRWHVPGGGLKLNRVCHSGGTHRSRISAVNMKHPVLCGNIPVDVSPDGFLIALITCLYDFRADLSALKATRKEIADSVTPSDSLKPAPMSASICNSPRDSQQYYPNSAAEIYRSHHDQECQQVH